MSLRSASLAVRVTPFPDFYHELKYPLQCADRLKKLKICMYTVLQPLINRIV